MKNILKFILTVSIISIVFACNKNQNEKWRDRIGDQKETTAGNSPKLKEEEQVSSSDASNSFSSGLATSENVQHDNGKQFVSSSAAVETGKDSSRKFIRTAGLKFKVKSVINATYAIECIIGEQNGFVASTDLTSRIDNQSTIPLSNDSSVESTYFTVVNELVLRVPNDKLDTTLKSIAVLIDYLDYRNIKAEDVALKILANKLEKERAVRSARRLQDAIDKKGKKLNDISDAEALLSSTEEQKDNAELANLSLQDKINYSTINLSIYQRQTIKRELISNDKNRDAFTPGLGKRIADALKSGLEILTAIVVFAANCWSLLLLALIGYFLYNVFIRRPGK